jgi:hypothetical protein
MQGPKIFFRTDSREPPRDTIVSSLVDQDGLTGLEHVDIDLLRNDTDARFGSIFMPIQIMAENADLAAGFVDEGGDDPDRGRLTCTVRAQEREEVPFSYAQIYAFERLQTVGVDLAEILDGERVQ